MTEPLDLDEAEALLAAATPGPWDHGHVNFDLTIDDVELTLWLRNHADVLLAAYRDNEREDQP
jgi:hypothetical protein